MPINLIVATFDSKQGEIDLWEHATEIGTFYSVEVDWEEESRLVTSNYHEARSLALYLATR